MLIRALEATFGKLERRAIAFAPGLNVIEAPNESGKSTLAAFLCAMLYGVPTHVRGPLADKNRYLPWSGSPMEGSLELTAEGFGDVTLRRGTTRADNPMGRFSATYTGTGDEVPGLSAACCGEALLGVPREVFERSAFIRQGSLAVGQNAELERRIAALVSTGEEGASYSEAAAALRKRLNALRYNARGLIPTLERELAAEEETLSELRALSDEQRAAQDALDTLRGREAELRAMLEQHALADRQEQYAAREQLKRDADDAAREARVFRRMLADAAVPPREVLEENRARLRAAEELGRQRRDAEAKRQDAELALNQFDATPRSPLPRPAALLWLLCLLLCAAVPPAMLLFHLLPVLPAALYGSAAGVVLFAVLFVLEWLRERAARRERAAERGALESALRGAETVCAALRKQQDDVMKLVYADVPAGDAVSAGAYVHSNLARYDTLAQMEADAQDRRRYYESCPKPDLKGVPACPVSRPERSREELEREMAATEADRVQARSRADYTAGRLRSLGEAGELEAALTRKRERLDEAREEYDALALAAEALERANTALQGRFSPELGRRAAAYFSALTGGRYGAVELDRALHALVTESGGGAARDAQLLSRGAADQLYLAVRLAICDLVLPADKRVPLVLDDALTEFDDARCAAALELLLRESASRQILLLTCRHREAEYLTDRENVTILSL